MEGIKINVFGMRYTGSLKCIVRAITKSFLVVKGANLSLEERPFASHLPRLSVMLK